METFRGESISAFNIAAIMESQNLSTSTVCGAAITCIAMMCCDLQSQAFAASHALYTVPNAKEKR